METVHSSPLPTLSPEDQALLTAYFEAKEDLIVLAKKPGSKDLLSLLQWLSQPDIAAYIQAYRAHQSQLDRNLVIHALRSVIKTTTDPIETRRAATTLLRALNPLRPAHPAKESGSPSFSSPKSRRHPASNRAGPRNNPRPAPPSPAANPVPPSSAHPFTSPPPHPLPPQPLPPHSRPSLEEALAILGIPNLTDEEEDALEDAEIDGFDDEPFDSDENTS